MKTTNRILQIISFLGAIAAGVFYFSSTGGEEASSDQVKRLQADNRQQRTKAAKLHNELEKLREELAETRQNLEKQTSESLLAQSQAQQLRRENQRLFNEREAQTIAEQRLQRENSRISQELSELQARSISRDQVASLEQTIESLEREILELQQTRPAATPFNPALAAPLPTNPSLTGNVLTVGKGASFVVLDIGYADGVRLQNELFIRHADTPIAKIQVTEVKENLSIARVLPESLTKTPQSGDSVASLN